ncbi:TrmH family RNA methyltransferase [uncultured Duncaniella sp.]|uniref:TrmH family RNA methyltransferase n=1 Tax=uncultured Duncaniella sp. TaxID=2768039 RepID=UPI0025B6ABB2|nr:TrmH family RNA methyltransferase [uncultured Duncaniella sp.]
MDRRKKDIVELTKCSLRQYRELEKLPLAIMADNVRSMYNIGAMLRTADAFLVGEMVMAGISGCPPHPEITKTALGAEESVSWRHVGDAVAEARRMQAQGWTVCVLEQAHDSVPLDSFAAEAGRRYLLVVGNEVEGVDQRIVDLADMVLEIPQAGVKHSLNVSVSAGIALWHMSSTIKELQ